MENTCKEYITKQENIWSGEFGNTYVDRNTADRLHASSLAFFSRVLARAPGTRSAVELGANVGANLRALAALVPGIDLSAVEINARAVEALLAWGGCTVHHASLLDIDPTPADIAFTRGVLIHIDPERLGDAYDRLYKAARRYILVAEYYNPSPVSIEYRGEKDILFKRDFAGELMDLHRDLSLVDYGFVYHRDPNFPQDDITWFLMEKVK